MIEINHHTRYNFTKPAETPAPTIKKGARLDRVVAFDTETTGFGNSDEILQISFCHNNGQERDYYIRPVRHSSWNSAMAINHITPSMVMDKPTANELRAEIVRIFEEADVIVGYNLAFDTRMVKNVFGYEIPKNKQFDAMKFFKKFEPDNEGHKLADAYKFYTGKNIDDAHNSLADTRATLEVFRRELDAMKRIKMEQANVITQEIAK